MNKKVIIISLVAIAILTIVSLVLIISIQNKALENKLETVNAEKTQVQSELDTILNDKDENNYLPTDVVKYFVNELKNGSTEKAKLYVSKEDQVQDFKEWLTVEDLTTLTTADSTYAIDGDTAKAQTTLTVGEDTINRIFTLIKEENIWKISDIEE